MALPMRTTDDDEGLVQPSNIVEVVDQLLRAWREPEKVIRHVEQKIQIPGKDIRILTTVHINPQAFGAKDEIIFPLWSPLKGEAVDAEVLNRSKVMLLTHEESEALAISALAFRIIKLWHSCHVNSAKNKDVQNKLDELMQEMLKDVPKIPQLPQGEAAKVYNEFFTDSYTIKEQKFPSYVMFDPASEYNLCLLARRLTRRSLTLAQVMLDSHPKIEILSFQTWDQQDTKETTKDGQQVAEDGNKIKRLLSPISTDPQLKIHLPWAKKSRHYSLKIDLPEGYFFLNNVTIDVEEKKKGKNRSQTILRWH